MPGVGSNGQSWQLPAGYLAVPMMRDHADAVVQVCVVVRREPEAVAGHLVVLRDSIDARVVLGCLVDAGGTVHKWLEVWIQDLDQMAGTTHAYHESISNRVLDERWRRHADAFRMSDPTSSVETGWEDHHPPPIWLDLDAGLPVHPEDPETGAAWRLCEDDAALQTAGLPSFTGSLHRYLHKERPGDDEGGDEVFVPMTSGAPTNERTADQSTIFDESMEALIPFNPAGGLMMVRSYSPIGYGEAVDLVGGRGWPGALHGRSPLDLGQPTDQLATRDDLAPTTRERMFLGKHGQAGRLIEGFHLKLRALADAVSSVREMVRDTQRPNLSLSEEHFQVRLSDPGVGLPALWAMRTVLVDPGNAIRLPIDTSSTPCYLRGETAMSIFHPGSAAAGGSGRGSLRIRQVLDEQGGRTVIEGTFSTQERVEAARNDLVWLRLNLRGGRVDLYGRVEEDSALAAGEWRVRTVPQSLDDDLQDQLRQAAGVPIADVAFEVIPLLSSPCDLYALAVLGVRTMLVDGETSLPVALDEILSLAQQAAYVYDDASSLELRLQGLFDDDPRWMESLGPHRLTFDDLGPADAMDIVPAELWWETLSLLIRMFPGVGPDSFCADYGDAEPGGIHKVFDPVLEELERLIIRTRSLIVIDWRFNREVHAVIRRFMTGTLG